MELPCRILEQIAFNTRPKLHEHLLKIMDKSFPEENLSIPLQTNKKQFKIAIIFLTDYNGIFNVTVRNNNFHFAKSSSNKDGFIQTKIPQGAYELESFHD